MGFKTGSFPPVDVETFLDKPFLERMKTLALHWVEYGFGTPRMVHTIYIAKVVLLYVLAGSWLITATSGLGPLWNVGSWWAEPIFYQKAILWTVLLETVGVAGSWGPLAGKFKPMTGGILFWARPNTLRLPPWPGKVPATAGDRRTAFDVLLYLLILANLGLAVVLPGVPSGSLAELTPQANGGLVNPALMYPLIALFVVMGLRDKIVFIAARSEQYLPAMVFFAFLGATDQIISLKLLIVVVWIGAGVSKFGRHFSNVVPPMVSNTPFVFPRFVRRMHYRDFPRDIRPSRWASLLAHVGGSTVECVTPLVLLFSTNRTLTLLAVALMVLFHAFILITFPLAVPLEWNVLFGFAAAFLFWGHPAWAGYGVADMSSPWLTIGIVVCLLVFPVLGNLRPDLVSFLPSMRQYAGNWASATWAFAPGAEAKLNRVVRSSGNQIDQLTASNYPPKIAEITMQQTMAWRSMHSQGRGLLSVMINQLGPDIDRYTIREAEFACNSLIGFNFGDGHLHDAKMISALQRRCQFEPGEFLAVWVESQAIHQDFQNYQVIDAARGVIERGRWRVADAVDEQPWLPRGPIPTEVHWRATGQADPSPTPQAGSSAPRQPDPSAAPRA
jgi:transmembrane protein DUF3556